MAANAVVSILIRAKDEASAALAGVKGKFSTFASEMKGFFSGLLGGALELFELKKALADIVETTFRFNLSMRDLAAASKIAEIPFDFLQHVAREVETKLQTSKTVANQFAEELGRLGAKAGDLTLVDKNLTAIFDVLAAQGFKGEDALLRLQQAIEGNDRVIKKLFNTRPDTLYTEFANSINKTTEQLTEANKAQAIFAAFADRGARTMGTLNEYLASTEHQVEMTKDEFENFKVTIGTSLMPALSGLMFILRQLLLILEADFGFIQGVGTAIGATFRSVAEVMNGVSVGISFAISGDFTRAGIALKQGLKNAGQEWSDAAETMMNDYTTALDLMKEENIGFDQAMFDLAQRRLAKRMKQLDLERQKQDEIRKRLEDAREEEKREAREREQEHKARFDNALALLENQAKRTDLTKEESEAIAARLVQLQADLAVEAVMSDKLSDQVRIAASRNKIEAIYTEILAHAQEKLNERTAQELAALRESKRLREEQAAKELQAIQLRIAVHQQTAADVTALKALEQSLLHQLQAKNLTLEDEIKLRERLNDVVQTEQSLNRTMTQFTDGLRQAVAGPLADFFSEGIKGFGDLSNAVKAFATAVTQAFINVAAQIAANSILQQIFGTGLSLAAGSIGGGNGSGGGSVGQPERMKAFAEGGIVSGPGGPTGDAVLAQLSAGEGILTARAVNALGGAAAINFLNQLGSIGGPRVSRFADGGIAGAAVSDGRAGGDSNIMVGLEEGLVLKHLDSAAGARVTVKHVAQNRRHLSTVLGGNR